MARRNRAQKRVIGADPVYNSRLVNMVISHLIKDGKKSLAYSIIYDALKQIEATTEQDPIKVLEAAIRHTSPTVEVKARRVGGATYQVPTEVPQARGNALALRWILHSARNRSGRNMISKLAGEIIDASNYLGNAVRKKEETHKMAEANKAFAHFRF